MNLAAVVAVSLLGVIALFQVALALGAPWGSAAWGGRRGDILPTRYRVASGFTGLFVYPGIAYSIASAGGLLGEDRSAIGGQTGMWVLAGLFGLAAIGNLASRSKPERWWAPVAITIALCCAYLAS